ncbi:hypothetical protein ACX80O_08220 [Arthrobacter sp. Hz1]
MYGRTGPVCTIYTDASTRVGDSLHADDARPETITAALHRASAGKSDFKRIRAALTRSAKGLTDRIARSLSSQTPTSSCSRPVRSTGSGSGSGSGSDPDRSVAAPADRPDSAGRPLAGLPSTRTAGSGLPDPTAASPGDGRRWSATADAW